MENNVNINAQEQDFSELLKIRRDKLAALREAGNDPFVITKYDVTAYSASADIVIFGEAFLQGFYGATFDMEHDTQIAISQDDPIIKEICSAAKQCLTAVSFGFIEKEGSCFYSSQITIDANGSVIDLYRRVSPGWKESFASTQYREGNGFHAFQFMDQKVVVGLCGGHGDGLRAADCKPRHLAVSRTVDDLRVAVLAICAGDNGRDFSLESVNGQQRRKEGLRDSEFGFKVSERNFADVADVLLGAYGALGDGVELCFKLTDRIFNRTGQRSLPNAIKDISVRRSDLVDNFPHDGKRDNGGSVRGVDWDPRSLLFGQLRDICACSAHQLLRHGRSACPQVAECFAVFLAFKHIAAVSVFADNERTDICACNIRV